MEERWPKRGGRWPTSLHVSTTGVAARWLGPVMLHSISSSEAKFSSGSESCSSSSLGNQQANLFRPRGPSVPTQLWARAPVPACSAFTVRNSTGGGLQSVGNMSSEVCILGFFDDLGVGAELGLERHRVGWRSLWSRGWSKPLCFRLGKRMGMVAAVWTPVGGISTAVSPPAHHYSTIALFWVKRGNNSLLLQTGLQGNPPAIGFPLPVVPNLSGTLPVQVKDTYLLSEERLAQCSGAWTSANLWTFCPGRNHLSGEVK